MTRKRKIQSYLTLCLLSLFLFGGNVLVASAQVVSGNTTSTQSNVQSGQTTGIQPSVALINPIRVNSITEFLAAILNIVMILMIPIIVFFIILSGFKYVTARGNSSQTEEATQSLLYAIIGGVLILGALVIVQIIRSLVDAFVV